MAYERRNRLPETLSQASIRILRSVRPNAQVARKRIPCEPLYLVFDGRLSYSVHGVRAESAPDLREAVASVAGSGAIEVRVESPE
jgi:hypothetical protein